MKKGDTNKLTLSLTTATEGDAAIIAELKNAAALDLTVKFGKGHWSYLSTEKGVLNGMIGNSKVLIAKLDNKAVGTLRLTSKKPWAIDPAYFTPVDRTIYLVDMAVHPEWQKKGIGSFVLQEVRPFALLWPAQSIRLDAYDAAAGAGEFYRKCGFTEKGRVMYRGNPLIYFEVILSSAEGGLFNHLC